MSTNSPRRRVTVSPRLAATMVRNLLVTISFPLLIAAARFVPFDRLPSTCGFHFVTGLPCPTCGMTRAVMAIAHLNFERAWQMNPMAFAFVGIFGLWWVCSLYETATGHRASLMKWARKRVTLLAVLGLLTLFVFGAARVWMLAHSAGIY